MKRSRWRFKWKKRGTMFTAMVALLCCFLLPATALPGPAPANPSKQPPANPSQQPPAEVKAAGPPLDMILVLDNSGSMKKNDPESLVPVMVGDFLRNMGDRDRLGVVVFDSTARLITPLSPRKELRDGAELEKIRRLLDYRGQRTNIHLALERAVYELRENGRENAVKSLLLLTDGRIDTGDTAMDREQEKRVRESLAPAAAAQKIRICGIAFTENADYLLLQSLAAKTKGRYFRVLHAEKLSGVLNKLKEFLQRPPVVNKEKPEKTGKQPAPPGQDKVRKTPAQAPASASTPPPRPVQQPAPPGPGERPTTWNLASPSPPVLKAAAVLGLVVLLVLIWQLLKKITAKAKIPKIILEYLGPNRKLVRDEGGYTQPFSPGTRFTFQKPIILMGRKLDRRKQINELAIPDPEKMISKEHAKLMYRREDDELYLMDRHSTNGTYMGAARMEPDTPRLVKSGDEFSIHHHLFRIEIEGKPVSGKTGISVDDEGTRLDGFGEDAEERASAGNDGPRPAAGTGDPRGHGPETGPELEESMSAQARDEVEPMENEADTGSEHEEETMVTGMNFCANHPSRQADQICAQCGKLLCRDCALKQDNGQFFCSECKEEKDD